MPHVIVKFYPGRSDEEKRAMADAVAAALHATMGYEVANVSVCVEEVEQADWMARVYEPDIVQRQHQLVKPPGYGPLAGYAGRPREPPAKKIVGRSRAGRSGSVLRRRSSAAE